MPPSGFGLLHSHVFTLERGAGVLRNIISTPSVSQEGTNLTKCRYLGKNNRTASVTVTLLTGRVNRPKRFLCVGLKRAVRGGWMRFRTGLHMQEGRLYRGYMSIVACFADKQRWFVFHIEGCLQSLAAYSLCICTTIKMRNAGRCKHGVERSHS